MNFRAFMFKIYMKAHVFPFIASFSPLHSNGNESMYVVYEYVAE